MVQENQLYTDGGVILVNPSPHGGTWAYRHVIVTRAEATTETVGIEGSGLVLPADVGLLEVGNNLTELLAVINGLEMLPDLWEGTIFTDSLVTIRRVMEATRKPPKGIPPAITARLIAVKQKIGPFGMQLVGGHPNKKELAAGVRKDGKMVSVHNVWCDEECGRMTAHYLAHREKTSDA